MYDDTEWKFQHFSVTQILREIIFGHFQIILVVIQTWEYTMWKFHDFFASQSLHEVNFGHL